MTRRKPHKCPTCLSAIPAIKFKHGFVATEHPPTVFYRGAQLDLRPMGARILIRLLGASYVDRVTLRGAIADERTMHVHLTAIRHALPEGFTLQNDFAKGYRLITV